MDITRHLPPMVAQTYTDSCWAAALESWSRLVSWFPNQQQQALCHLYGEGPNRGITPATKIPLLASKYGLQWGGFAGGTMHAYLNRHLPHSHVYCAYTNGAFTHAVLIYRLSGRGNVSFMDPNGGRDRWEPLSVFDSRGPFVCMRRPTPADPW